MAQIDLKNATIYIRDGYTGATGTARVNKPGQYATSTTTMVVDGVTGIIPTGATFLVTGDAQVYTISAHSETLGNTTSVTFSPGLVVAADDNDVITFKQVGAVNNGAGYMAGASTILVDAFVGIIPNASTFVLQGHVTVYTVTGHSETLGNTTSLTFTPVLAFSAADDDSCTVSRLGAVNLIGTYLTGAVTMLVDGISEAVLTGDIFTVAGETGSPRHRITSHIETLGLTTSITFTGALASTVSDNALITWLPHELEVNVGEGTLSYTEKRNMEYKKNRGVLDTVREGDEEPVDVKLDAQWEFLRSVSGAATPTIEEALKNVGQASGWVTSASDTCEPYAVDVVIVYTPPCEGIPDETITLQDYRWESLEHDAKAGTISTSGKCNITQATVVRGS